MTRARWVGRGVLLATCWIACASSEAGSAEFTPERCTRLTSEARKWPDPTTRITSAGWQAAGSSLTTSTGPLSLPAHCEVTGVMHERTGAAGQKYAIRFKMRLPQAWNQRFFFQGGGGTNGEIGDAVGPISPRGPTALALGYAVVSQDSGHDNARNSVAEQGGVVAFGFDPQARADYGGTSLKPVAEAAKALIRGYYGRAPTRSYFVGCSKGGQEGMVFAQRYPEVFDGIVAGAPGFSLPRAALAEVWDTQAFASLIDASSGQGKDPSKLPTTFSNAQFARVRNAVLAACDADDGVADGITADWSRCDWPRANTKLQEQVCLNAADCLNAAQIDVLGRVFSGAKDSKGTPLYVGWPFDGGIGADGWRVWKIGPQGGEFPGINVVMGAPSLAAIFTTPPTGLSPSTAFDYAMRFDFDRDAPKIYATDATFTRSAWEDIGARSPDLARFRVHGGKMIVPHGVSDPVFSINDTVAWYREVDQRNDNKAAEFVRVFPVPGMNHCAGGPATDQYNVFDALVDWVEKATPPDRILATASPLSPWPGRTRPLCPYPQVARYNGSGSIENAVSFRCE